MQTLIPISPVVRNLEVQAACAKLATTENANLRSALTKALSAALVKLKAVDIPKLKRDRAIVGKAKGNPAIPGTWPSLKRLKELNVATREIRHRLAVAEGQVRDITLALQDLHFSTHASDTRARKAGERAMLQVLEDRDLVVDLVRH